MLCHTRVILENRNSRFRRQNYNQVGLFKPAEGPREPVDVAWNSCRKLVEECLKKNVAQAWREWKISRMPMYSNPQPLRGLHSFQARRVISFSFAALSVCIRPRGTFLLQYGKSAMLQKVDFLHTIMA